MMYRQVPTQIYYVFSHELKLYRISVWGVKIGCIRGLAEGLRGSEFVVLRLSYGRRKSSQSSHTFSDIMWHRCSRLVHESTASVAHSMHISFTVVPTVNFE